MQEVLFGLLALAVGAVFCFGGFGAFRILLPIWGFFAGFTLSLSAVANVTGDGFFATTLGWIVGLVIGLAFAAFAYFFYAAAIIIFAASIGFWLFSGLLALLIDRGFLTGLVGAIGAIVFAGLALRYRLPSIVVFVFTAFFGAISMVAGVMLMINQLQLSDFENGIVDAVVTNSAFWSIIWLALGLFGLLTQLQLSREMNRQAQLELKEYWVEV
jgi:hypothetical protein